MSAARPGCPSKNLPPEIVKSAEETVDASLAGLDHGEQIPIPPLPALGD